MKYYLVSGEDRFLAGATPPVYDEDFSAWRYDGGLLTDVHKHRQVQFEIVAPIPPIVSPVEFEMLWSVQELIGIADLRKTNEVVDMFMKRLENPKLTEVNLALQSVQDGIEYTLGCLAAALVIGPDDIPVRFGSILTGAIL
jgi:hypothetical protein